MFDGGIDEFVVSHYLAEKVRLGDCEADGGEGDVQTCMTNRTAICCEHMDGHFPIITKWSAKRL